MLIASVLMAAYAENIIESEKNKNKKQTCNWYFCQNKQVLATLHQDYNFFWFFTLPPNQYKITNLKFFADPVALHKISALWTGYL